MTPLEIIMLAERLVALIGSLALEVTAIRGLAKQAGASDADLDALDQRLTAAIAARRAE